jgi:hypothetical protein
VTRTLDRTINCTSYDLEKEQLEHFPSALNRRDSQPLSPRRIWGN